MSLTQKPRELWFLIGAFSSWTVYYVFAICGEAVYPPWPSFYASESFFGLLGVLQFLGFAYQFRGNPYPREFRIAMTAGGILVGAYGALLGFQVASNRPSSWLVGSGISLLLFLWAEVVLVQRWLSTPNRQAARPYLEFAVVFLLSVVAITFEVMSGIGVLPGEIAAVITSLLFLANLVGFTFVYVNNAPSPTTFRVKIVGAALFAVLSVLTVLWTAVASSWTEHGNPVPALQTGTGLADGRLRSNTELITRLAAQNAILRCNYCIIGSAFFVLIFFPAFFRFSLVDPLNELLTAVDQIEAGSRDVNLTVRFNDEIGRLTVSFNRMTRSLKGAEDNLRYYAESLEQEVQKRTAELRQKNEENERLLLNIFPASIAERLKRGEELIADARAEVTIVFADIVGFTDLSSRVPAHALVNLLNDLISEFDQLAREHGVEKIKTIGDAYMAVAGLNEPRPDHADAAVRFSFDILRAAARRTAHEGRSLQLRVGINSGPVVAGVIGTHKFAYDLWGDTVNTAARMESHGEPNRIQVTEATYKRLKNHYEFESRGEVDVKGKGWMPTYFIAAPGVSIRAELNASSERDHDEAHSPLELLPDTSE